MNTAEELDIITRMRGEVMSRQDLTGENLFLAWGYPTVIVLLAEFVALLVWNENWCAWLWAGIPLIGAPLMLYFLNKDYDRTHSRTLEQNIILVMWIFIGFASCVGGAIMGLANAFQHLALPSRCYSVHCLRATPLRLAATKPNHALPRLCLAVLYLAFS